MRIVAASVVIAAFVGVASCSSGNGGTGGAGGHCRNGGFDTAGCSSADGGPTDGPVVDSGPFDEFQIRNLNDINMYRATLSIPPVTLDTTLSAFAQAGT